MKILSNTFNPATHREKVCTFTVQPKAIGLTHNSISTSPFTRQIREVARACARVAHNDRRIVVERVIPTHVDKIQIFGYSIVEETDRHPWIRNNHVLSRLFGKNKRIVIGKIIFTHPKCGSNTTNNVHVRPLISNSHYAHAFEAEIKRQFS